MKKFYLLLVVCCIFLSCTAQNQATNVLPLCEAVNALHHAYDTHFDSLKGRDYGDYMTRQSTLAPQDFVEARIVRNGFIANFKDNAHSAAEAEMWVEDFAKKVSACGYTLFITKVNGKKVALCNAPSYKGAGVLLRYEKIDKYNFLLVMEVTVA